MGLTGVDPWLERWTAALGSSAPRLLELGCGDGRDTQVLLDAGIERLTALDLSESAVARCQARSSSLNCLVHDLREPLPFADAMYDVVVASLCLHYFPWPTTQAITAEIRRVLVPGGLLLCRVNSTNDVHYGATGFPELDHHFYQVGAATKRFFDRADLAALFADGWRWVAAEERQIDRYEHPKMVWELALRAQP